MIFILFVDDALLFSPKETEIEQAIKDLKNSEKAKTSFDIEDKGNINDYLGINFKTLSDGRLKLSQPHLIDEIIQLHLITRC